jgi:hypothetical protein
VWEAELLPLLQASQRLSAVTLLEELERRHPGEYGPDLLRTLQRRTRLWRAAHGGARRRTGSLLRSGTSARPTRALRFHGLQRSRRHDPRGLVPPIDSTSSLWPTLVGVMPTLWTTAKVSTRFQPVSKTLFGAWVAFPKNTAPIACQPRTRISRSLKSASGRLVTNRCVRITACVPVDTDRVRVSEPRARSSRALHAASASARRYSIARN